MIKKKFIIELDEEPALVFIQEKDKHVPIVYQDGKKVNGIRSIDINADIEQVTTHRIEYVTGCTRG